jgi:hypothetical protein
MYNHRRFVYSTNFLRREQSMMQDEAEQLKQKIHQEVKFDISVRMVVGRKAIVNITTDQTPDGYLVWVEPDGTGKAQSLASFISYEEWQSYLDSYLEL